MSGEVWWSQGYSEPGSGSDLASLKCKAERRGDYYIVNGQKTWTTLGQYGDWIFCLVRTSNEGKPQTGISFLLIDMKSPGVTVRPIIMLDGGHEVNEVWFDNVEVPAENLVGEENKGWTYAKHLLAHERTNIADVNRAKRELERLKRIAKAEGVYEDARFRDEIAMLEVDIVALEMMVLRVLSAEKSGKRARRGRPAEDPRQRDRAALQRADDAGRRALRPALRAGGDGRRLAGRPRRRGALRAAGRHLLQHAQDHDLRRQQRSAAQHRRRRPCSGAIMDFDFTDDQQSLRDAVSRWVDKGYTFERRPASPRPAAARARPTPTGRPGPDGPGRARGPRRHGLRRRRGDGGDGRARPRPGQRALRRGALVAPALLSPRRPPCRPQWLPKIAEGSALVVLAHQERSARYRLNHVTTTATRAARLALSGPKSVVPAGDEADAFIVPARIAGAAGCPASRCFSWPRARRSKPCAVTHAGRRPRRRAHLKNAPPR